VILEVGVLTFMVVLRWEEDVNLLGCNRRVYAGEDYLSSRKMGVGGFSLRM
jgi:hypothetical protein